MFYSQQSLRARTGSPVLAVVRLFVIWQLRTFDNKVFFFYFVRRYESADINVSSELCTCFFVQE